MASDRAQDELGGGESSDDERDKGHKRRRFSRTVRWGVVAAGLVLCIVFAEELHELRRSLRGAVRGRLGGIGGRDRDRAHAARRFGRADTAGADDAGRPDVAVPESSPASVETTPGVGNVLTPNDDAAATVPPPATEYSTEHAAELAALREEISRLKSVGEEQKSKHARATSELEALRAQLATASLGSPLPSPSSPPPGAPEEPARAGGDLGSDGRSQGDGEWPGIDAPDATWPGWQAVPPPRESLGFPGEPSKAVPGCERLDCTSPPGTCTGHVGGDAEDLTALRAAAAARSYRGEIIVYGTTADGLYAQYAHALVLRLEALGLRHHMAIAQTAKDCPALKEAMSESGAGEALGGDAANARDVCLVGCDAQTEKSAAFRHVEQFFASPRLYLRGACGARSWTTQKAVAFQPHLRRISSGRQSQGSFSSGTTSSSWTPMSVSSRTLIHCSRTRRYWASTP